MFSKSIFNTNPPKTFNFTSPLIPKNPNPNKDFEVVYPPDDTVSSMEFSPSSLAQNYLIAGSWDSKVRCWEIEQSGKTIPKCIQTCGAPVLDVSWSDDGQRVYTASCDGHGSMWDLASDKLMQVAAHDAPVKTCHWIKSPNYKCLMTGSWDKTLKFWDTRTPTPILKIDLPGKCYYADVLYPMAVVGTSSNSIIIYRLDGRPQEYRRVEAPLKHQVRCIAIFRDSKNKKDPVGYATGSIEGRVAIQYVDAASIKENFTFKCHRRTSPSNPDVQDIYPVNAVKFHPVHGTLATVGADGTFTFWDKDARTKLKPGENMHVQLNTCAFNHNGQIFAYDIGYDWSRGHEGNNPEIKSKIFLRPCYEECKPRSS